MISVLHITPHLGGGVGRVLLNYFGHIRKNDQERHRIVCLDYANPKAVERAATIGIPLEDRMAGLHSKLLSRMTEADVVVIHWWNHPLLYALMVRETIPPTRLLLWSHVSGIFPTQNFTDALIDYPDIFVIASPVSYDAPAVKKLQLSARHDKIRLIFSCAGFEHIASTQPLAHNGFKIGYVGTVDYCKLHPDFIQMSVAADIADAHFLVCGGPNEKVIRQDAINAGVDNHFEFLGQVSDVAAHLSTFDLFGYPLAPYHYGTGEQALIEALAVGVPPVVLANGAEQYIVQDGVTGIVAGDTRAYSHALKELRQNRDLRFMLSENARRAAREKFTIERVTISWSALYLESMQYPKRPRSWAVPLRPQPTAAEIYLASLGEYGAQYSTSMALEIDAATLKADDEIANGTALFRSKTRGSAFHYLSFFPDDPWLNFWCGLIEFNESNYSDCRKHLIAAKRIVGEKRIARYLGPYL